MPPPSSSKPEAKSPPCYGDYPELFWDMKPDEPILADHPMIIARVLREGSLKAIFELVPFDLLERHLPDLVVPEYVRRFWSRVLEIRCTANSWDSARA